VHHCTDVQYGKKQDELFVVCVCDCSTHLWYQKG
jgi:hypothetical protein